MNDNDTISAKFDDAYEQGLITDVQPRYWMPTSTKDGKWKNYYFGQTGTLAYLSGGLMIDDITKELKLVDLEELDHSLAEITTFNNILSSLENSGDEELVKIIKSVLQDLKYEFDVINYDSLQSVFIFGKGFSIGTQAPLTFQFKTYGFDPQKTKKKKFEDTIRKFKPKRFSYDISYIPEIDGDGNQLDTFSETGLEFSTKIDKPITEKILTTFIKKHSSEINNLLLILDEYRFKD